MSSRIIKDYFPELSENQLIRLNRLMPIYSEWNSKINVISRKDFENFELHHLVHSLGISKVISFCDGTTVLDVGTGGGFPGIPLAIMFPETRFTLVDSIRKKTDVVKAVANELGLENVEVVCSRVEELDGEFDFIVSRAVTDFLKFVGWTKKLIKAEGNNSLKNGILYLKGGDLTTELKPFKTKVHIYNLNSYFSEEFFTEKRVVYLPY